MSPALKIDRSALKKARETGAIPSRPVVGRTNFGSTDDNYPLFRATQFKGRVLLAYIPDMRSEVLLDEDGDPMLDMDIYRTHTVKDPRNSSSNQIGTSHRCVNKIVLDEFGLNGDCPMCTTSYEMFQFINEKVIENEPNLAHIASTDPAGTDSKAYKDARSAIFKSLRTVDGATSRYTLPIALVEAEAKRRKVGIDYVPVLEDVEVEKDGETKVIKAPKVTYYYLDLSETKYTEFKKAYEKSIDIGIEYDNTEGASQLYNSWILIDVPDEESPMDVGRNISFSRYTRAERLRPLAESEDKDHADFKLSRIFKAIEAKCNREMNDTEGKHGGRIFDSITAMEVLVRNKIEPMDTLMGLMQIQEEHLSSLQALYAENGVSGVIGGGAKAKSLNSALDSALGEGETTTATQAQGTASLEGAKTKVEPQPVVSSDDDIFA